jgi:hypothetical protein
MHSCVLTGAVAVPGHMSASGSRGIIHRQSSVVTVARATDKISCFPPPLVCIRTVSAHADPLTIEPPSSRLRRVDRLHHAATPMSCAAGVAVGFGSFMRNSEPSRHIACMITVSLRATATQARLWPRFLAIFSPQAFKLQELR